MHCVCCTTKPCIDCKMDTVSTRVPPVTFFVSFSHHLSACAYPYTSASLTVFLLLWLVELLFHLMVLSGPVSWWWQLLWCLLTTHFLFCGVLHISVVHVCHFSTHYVYSYIFFNRLFIKNGSCSWTHNIKMSCLNSFARRVTTFFCVLRIEFSDVCTLTQI
jgi:hypothetical protein